MSGVWSFLGVLVGGYLALLLALFLFQSHLIYFPNVPSRELVVSPEAIGLAYEEVTFAAADGVALHGWFVPAPQARGVLLFFHGNAGNISHRLDSVKIFHDLGLSTLIFDYRGYGRSQGSPAEEGTYLDAEAAWRHLTEERQVPDRRIILFGRSLGAAVAAYLASRRPAGALILESAFTSAPDLAADLYPWLPARWLARFRYSTKDYLESIDCPLLVVHSPDDEIIPYAHGQRLYAMAPEPKQFLELRGGHNEGFWVSRGTYVAGLERFLENQIE